jgi:small GTP-binding protein
MASNIHTYDPDEKELEESMRKDQDEAINKITNSNKLLSILVAGASSNGKSSIVSEVFGMNVGIGLDGAPTTNGIKTYTCKEKRLLLIDTPGLERKNNKETVAKLCQCKPDILWLVLNYGSSIEEEELKIAELFPQVPTIVILNKVDTLQINKLTDDDIEDFDSAEADVLPEKLKNNHKLMTTRQRLINWKLKKTANIQRIVIMSLRNEITTDKPVGIINLCEATWMSCDYVASVTFTQAQQVWQGDKIKGSIGIIIFSIALTSGKMNIIFFRKNNRILFYI